MFVVSISELYSIERLLSLGIESWILILGSANILMGLWYLSLNKEVERLLEDETKDEADKKADNHQ